MINKFAALLLIGMASPYQSLDWYGGRHTCHTASGALDTTYYMLDHTGCISAGSARLGEVAGSCTGELGETSEPRRGTIAVDATIPSPSVHW